MKSESDTVPSDKEESENLAIGSLILEKSRKRYEVAYRKSENWWLASCSNDDDCRKLKNATCMDGLCNCGEKFKVCEYVTNNKSVNLIGSKCNESKNCNITFAECHEMKKECVCKDGFIASNDFMTCLKVGKQVSDTGGKPGYVYQKMNLPESDSEDELPPGWEERVTVDGSVFYANHLTKATQWTHPRTGKKKRVSGDLPFGWERCIDKNTGKVIYVDHENRRTTYTDPRLAFAVEEKEHPNDYRQRFDASSTALQVLHGRDLNGKVALITGANAGIGFETARSLAKHGCSIIFACRNLTEATKVINQIREEKQAAGESCVGVHLDLGDLHSVEVFANQVKTMYKQIDILILNAGVFGLPYSKTVDGYETTFQVNHLGHFYLTLLLKPLLVTGSRIVVVSSESHRFANLTVDNISTQTLSPEAPSKYWDMMAYNNSKLCNILFARQLAKKLQPIGIAVFSLHPGNMVSSKLSRNWWIYRVFFALVRPFTKSLQQAASTTVFCATAVELTGVTGVYFNNCFRCEESENAKNDQLAGLLWKLSVEMLTGAVGKNVLALNELKS